MTCHVVDPKLTLVGWAATDFCATTGARARLPPACRTGAVLNLKLGVSSAGSPASACPWRTTWAECSGGPADIPCGRPFRLAERPRGSLGLPSEGGADSPAAKLPAAVLGNAEWGQGMATLFTASSSSSKAAWWLRMPVANSLRNSPTLMSKVSLVIHLLPATNCRAAAATMSWTRFKESTMDSSAPPVPAASPMATLRRSARRDC
mmetsp:Transcript_87019/g.245446  ORF Transcript_87019/g.245446 Transcript_87019/m.245446 type:complete len:206 (+) Transcript_87019:122-739(+)